MVNLNSYAQETNKSNVKDTLILPSDSLLIIADSLKAPDDTSEIATGPVVKSPNAIESMVDYNSDDSLIFDIKKKKVYLFGNYGKAEIKYQKIHLTSAYVEIDFDTKMLLARGFIDSTDNEIGKPLFSEGGQEFRSQEMLYNFDTKKGLIRKVITQEGEGFLHGDTIKKMKDDIIYIKTGKYTTCDHEHPHFELRFSKAKVIPNNKIVTGPAFLFVADVPTLLFVPFGMFPNKKGRTSGLIIPSYGESANRGFFLEDGGYYFGGSDYIDLAIKGDIYSMGSWAVKTNSNYNKRYKYNGNLAANYAINILGEKGNIDYSRNKDFLFQWRHNQDNRARPHSRFSANVNILSSQYNKFNPTSSNQYLSNTFSSSISYSTTIASKYNFSANLLHSQNTTQKTVDLMLPEITFSVNRFYPLRKKERAGQLKWYENISMDYKTNLRNKINTYDSLLFTDETLERFQNGMQHVIPVTSSIKLLKYFSMTNTVNYTERWYLRHIEKNWTNDTLFTNNDTIAGYVKTDTIDGFISGRDFNFSSTLNTRLFGMFRFRKGPVTALRHVITPSLNFTFRPDFGEEKWGYYKSYTDENTGIMKQYSIFEGAIFGGPPDGKAGYVNISIANNLEMKIKSRKDTISGLKKVILIENFTLSGSYNLAADSMNWSMLKMSGRTVLIKNLDIRYNSTWDPYVRDSLGNRINKFEWDEHKKLFRLENNSWEMSLNWRLGSKPKSGTKKSDKGTEEELNVVNKNPEEYVDFTIPWTFNISYKWTYNKFYNQAELARKENIIQTLSFNGDINITPNWKIGFNSGYDFEAGDFSYTQLNIYRNLHCWEMSFNWIPTGFRKSWSFTIKAKSALLQDLKLNKKKDFRDSY